MRLGPASTSAAGASLSGVPGGAVVDVSRQVERPDASGKQRGTRESLGQERGHAQGHGTRSCNGGLRAHEHHGKQQDRHDEEQEKERAAESDAQRLERAMGRHGDDPEAVRDYALGGR